MAEEQPEEPVTQDQTEEQDQSPPATQDQPSENQEESGAETQEETGAEEPPQNEANAENEEATEQPPESQAEESATADIETAQEEQPQEGQETEGPPAEEETPSPAEDAKDTEEAADTIEPAEDSGPAPEEPQLGAQGSPPPEDMVGRARGESPEEGDESPRMEEKATPEPPTEDMGTGTEAAAYTSQQQPPPQYDQDAQATVKFMLMPSQQVATLRCHLHQTLKELKEHFASELKIPAKVIMLTFDGAETDHDMSLGELGVGPNGTIQLEMQSVDPINTPIKRFKPRQEYHMPDVITVRVPADEGGFKDVVVEIERTTRQKPFLGGYRHKKTSVEYHHASCQTLQKPRTASGVEKNCRDTQTVEQRNMVQQTTNATSTQMTKIGVYVSNMTDKLVIPGKYTTADDYRSNILNRIVIIQKYYRRWLAKRYVEKVREDKLSRLEWEREEERKKKKEKEDRIRREFERRMNPKTKEDFDLLYHALEKWRQEEMAVINETLTGAERKAALCQLLEQETQLLASIGRHKIEADTENKEKSIQGFLSKAAAPKKWKGPDGKVTEMDTPYTIRAQELKDIYNSINMKYLTQDERLDVLLTLKHTVKEHDCKLTQEIIELIDREADLLMRGVKEANLDGLRKRISTLFLQYIKTPTFNPEASRLLKVPQDPAVLRKNIYFCPSCNQYLPSTEFQLSSNSRAVGKCRKCSKTDNDARIRQDYSHYRYMLKTLRESEESYDDVSNIAFLLQENDLRYLVENVWSSQSIVSAWEDLYDLVLVRWDKHTQWSPWNCILLTKEEAASHDKLEDLEEAYGKVFMHKVKHKHTLARNYFSRLPGMADKMREIEERSSAVSGPSVAGKGLSIVSAKA